MDNPQFESLFLNNSEKSQQHFSEATSSFIRLIAEKFRLNEKPYQGLNPIDQSETFSKINLLPEQGSDWSGVLRFSEKTVLDNALSVHNSKSMAHLHCPVMIPAVAAEIIISSLNQSMDSWDQAPGASMLEQAFLDQMCQKIGYDAYADGTFTSGGTQSNFMGLMLARDYYSSEFLNWDVQKKGLPPESSKFRIITSEKSHFSVIQSAAILGLGQQQVISIKCDDKNALDIECLKEVITEEKRKGNFIICISSTAGTTDFGSIDPLQDLAAICRAENIWLHVDAAFGGALLFSEKHSGLLKGIELSNSITIDFHKLFFMPISCSAFFVQNKSNFGLMSLNAEYLNPESNKEKGILDLVYKSIQTTRRFDALKPILTFQSIGTKKLGEMIDYTLHLAKKSAELVSFTEDLELFSTPVLNTVIFRFNPREIFDEKTKNQINTEIKLKLLLDGDAVIGQTEADGKIYLKFTLMNPLATLSDVSSVLQQICQTGNEIMKTILAEIAVSNLN